MRGWEIPPKVIKMKKMGIVSTEFWWPLYTHKHSINILPTKQWNLKLHPNLNTVEEVGILVRRWRRRRRSFSGVHGGVVNLIPAPKFLHFNITNLTKPTTTTRRILITWFLLGQLWGTSTDWGDSNQQQQQQHIRTPQPLFPLHPCLSLSFFCLFFERWWDLALFEEELVK